MSIRNIAVAGAIVFVGVVTVRAGQTRQRTPAEEQAIKDQFSESIETLRTLSVTCAIPGQANVSVGSLQTGPSDAVYRCVPTYDSSFKLSGAAWVRVNVDGTIRLPQQVAH